MKQAFLYIISSCLYLSIGCNASDELIIELPFDGPQSVIYGFLSANDSSSIQIFQSLPADEQTEEFNTSEVKASIFEGAEKINEFSVNEIETFKYSFLTDKEYSLELEWQNEIIKSEKIIIPPPVLMEELTFVVSSDSLEMNLSFILPDVEAVNYYSIEIKKFYKGKEVLFSNESKQVHNFSNVIADTEFKNSKKKFDNILKIRDFEIVNNMASYRLTDSIVVSLHALSDEFYLFYNNQSLTSNEIGNNFYQNAPPWSNLDQGYGFVGGYSTHHLSVTY